jgi:hypothetical protein
MKVAVLSVECARTRLWFGPSVSSGGSEFQVPEAYPLTAAGSRVDDAVNKFVSVNGGSLLHEQRTRPPA